MEAKLNDTSFSSFCHVESIFDDVAKSIKTPPPSPLIQFDTQNGRLRGPRSEKDVSFKLFSLCCAQKSVFVHLHPHDQIFSVCQPRGSCKWRIERAPSSIPMQVSRKLSKSQDHEVSKNWESWWSAKCDNVKTSYAATSATRWVILRECALRFAALQTTSRTLFFPWKTIKRHFLKTSVTFTLRVMNIPWKIQVIMTVRSPFKK